LDGPVLIPACQLSRIWRMVSPWRISLRIPPIKVHSVFKEPVVPVDPFTWRRFCGVIELCTRWVLICNTQRIFIYDNSIARDVRAVGAAVAEGVKKPPLGRLVVAVSAVSNELAFVQSGGNRMIPMN
jgi:hypothetical protein